MEITEENLYNKWSHLLDGIKSKDDESNREILKELTKDNWMNNKFVKTEKLNGN